MNNNQVVSFLSSVENLNFTTASHKLFISQPGLSRQIAALEQELGVKLFIRGRNSIKITEAGKICAEYLTEIRDKYDEMINKLGALDGNDEEPLILGGLEGQLIGKSYEEAFVNYWVSRPKTDLRISYYPATRLVKALLNKEVDVAILPVVEVKDIMGISWKVTKRDKCCLVVPVSHPKANIKDAGLKDFSDETFLIVAESDSSAISKQHREVCEASGFVPKQKIVSSFGTLSMLLEMGVGISVLNTFHSLYYNPKLKFLEIPEVGYRKEAVAWRDDSVNDPKIKVFLDLIPDLNEE